MNLCWLILDKLLNLNTGESLQGIRLFSFVISTLLNIFFFRFSAEFYQMLFSPCVILFSYFELIMFIGIQTKLFFRIKLCPSPSFL